MNDVLGQLSASKKISPIWPRLSVLTYGSTLGCGRMFLPSRRLLRSVIMVPVVARSNRIIPAIMPPITPDGMCDVGSPSLLVVVALVPAGAAAEPEPEAFIKIPELI